MAWPAYLPVRVFCRTGKNRAAQQTSAAMTEIAWVVLIASSSAGPVAALKSCGLSIIRAPSVKFCSEVPMIMRTRPFITNITPVETMTTMIGFALCLQ